MKIGYARVSTESQDLQPQIDRLTAHCDKIFSEKISGAEQHRPELNKAMREIGVGDTLVVTKLDRLGRSVSHLHELLNNLNEDGCFFQSLTDGMDTNTPAGKLVFGILAAVSEFERDLIRERVRDGVKRARDRKQHLGRPMRLDYDQITTARRLIKIGEHSISSAAELFGVSRSTMSRALSQRLSRGDVARKQRREKTTRDIKAANRQTA